MKLHRLKLENFRGVTAREIEFPDAGVVVVTGRNEIGKTSMIDALDALIALPDSSRKRTILDAKPAGRDVPVLVEAEFSIGPTRVVYTKQWLKKPTTILRHVTGTSAGRTVTGREAHDAAEQLWATADTTLWQALRYLQASGLDQNALTDSAALRRALESRAGEAQGDDREVATLLERVGAECDRYWTSTRKRNAKFVQAETDCREAETAAAAAAEELRGIAGVEDELAELTEEITDSGRKLAAARAEREELDRAAEQIEAVQRQQQEAQRRRDAAQGQLDRARERATRRTELVAALAADEERSSALADDLSACEEDLAPVREHAEEAEQRRAAAQAAVQEARAAHRSAREDQKHLDDVERHRRASTVLDSLETVRARLTELRSRPATEIDEDVLDDLDRAQRTAERAEAELAAGSARVELTAIGHARSIERCGATEEVRPEEPWSVPVTDEVEVEIPGEWRVRISPEQGIETRRDAAQQAAEAFAALLARHGVESVAEARAAWRDAQELDRQVREAEADRDRLLDGEDESRLRDERDRLAAAIEQYGDRRSGDAPLPESSGAAQATVEAAETALTEAEDAARRTEAAAQAARANLEKAQTRLHSLQGAALEQERALTAARARLEEARHEVPDEDLDHAVTHAGEALAAVQEEIDAHEAHLTGLDAERVLADRELVADQVAGLERLLADRQGRRSSLLGKLEGMGRDRVQLEHDQAETRLEAARRHLAAVERRAEAALLLERTLLAHRERAHAQYVQPFRSAVEQLGRAVYGPEFEVLVSGTLEVEQRKLDGDWLPFSALSTGAKEQLVILIRLATALLVDPEDGVPVLLDDALGHSDPQRLRRLASAIATAGERTQVIVLTSNPERFANLREARRIEM
ncbi:AAA family ATPase [Kocuria oceani]|uniref:AAA family ATPase n=1 Tax=Kocuria oceani TaxID=988827 RepID=A0ABV9TJ90_9MICC|nr:AAA family ATPase [Kocuria oceani]